MLSLATHIITESGFNSRSHAKDSTEGICQNVHQVEYSIHDPYRYARVRSKFNSAHVIQLSLPITPAIPGIQLKLLYTCFPHST